MAIMDPFFDYTQLPAVTTEWGPWKKKFAWKKTEVNSSTVWLKFYYARTGTRDSMFSPITIVLHETALDLFDVLKS